MELTEALQTLLSLRNFTALASTAGFIRFTPQVMMDLSDEYR